MRRALVLSGGGAKGGFQVGALRYIMEREAKGMPPSSYFEIISGTSVGALNGVMMAQNRYDALRGLWDHLSGGHIYRGSLGILPVFSRFMMRRPGLLSNAPLWETIKKNISLDAVDGDCDFIFGALTVDTGAYNSFRASDFTDERQFLQGILASSSMPVIWPPVKSITTGTGAIYRQLVDGGVRNKRPIGEVIGCHPDEVVIINCNADDFHPYPDPAKGMLRTAIRMLTEITINEIFRQDIREFLHINQIVGQLPAGVTVKKSDGTLFKKYRSILIEPSHDLGDALDFSRSKINLHMEKGYEAAALAYERSRATEILLE
jgi:NTE family protein